MARRRRWTIVKGSAHSHQKLGRQLVQAFVLVALGPEGAEIECAILEVGRRLRAVLDGRRVEPAESRENVLDLAISVEASDLLFEDEVRTHAVVREVPHAFLVFGAVRVAVEM